MTASRPRHVVLVVSLVVGLFGCSASAQFTRTAANPYPTVQRAPDNVAILDSGATPTRPVIEIGTLDGQSDAHAMKAGEEGIREVLLELRRVAGQQGCSAIVLGSPEEHLFATSNGTPLYKVHQQARCLVYQLSTSSP